KLWAEGQEPLAALREAQLELYRRPELIAALGQRRGGKLLEADWPELAQRPAEEGKAPVAAGAAFTFSGSRRRRGRAGCRLGQAGTGGGPCERRRPCCWRRCWASWSRPGRAERRRS